MQDNLKQIGSKCIFIWVDQRPIVFIVAANGHRTTKLMGQSYPSGALKKDCGDARRLVTSVPVSVH